MGKNSRAAKIRTLAKKGLPNKEIAELCGCTAGYVAKVKARPQPHEYRKKADKLVQSALSRGQVPDAKEIAKAVGCSISLVRSLYSSPATGISDSQKDYIEQMLGQTAGKGAQICWDGVDDYLLKKSPKQIPYLIRMMVKTRDFIKLKETDGYKNLVQPLFDIAGIRI